MYSGEAAPRERQVGCPFRFFQDSKHAYYLVFDFEIELTDKFGSTWEARRHAQRELGAEAPRAQLQAIPVRITARPPGLTKSVSHALAVWRLRHVSSHKKRIHDTRW